MKTVHLHVRHSGRTTTLVFTRFPVRIGREPPCECRLAFPFVSRLHAVLELHGGRLVLRDLGSRGGTFVQNAAVRIDGDKYVDLEKVDWEFQIGRLSVRAEVREDTSPTPRDGTPRADDDPDGLNATRVHRPAENETRAYDGAGLDPVALQAQGLCADLADALARYQTARANLDACVRATANEPDTPVRVDALRALNALPENAEGAVRETDPPPSTPVRQEAERAIGSLQELATHYVPFAPPLLDAPTVARFHGRLERTLRLLFDGFAALRFVYRAEDLRAQRGPVRGLDLGSKLLDWTSNDDALAAMENDIVAMIQNHARLSNDVASGIAKLLADLDPDRIERECQRPWLRAFQYRRFWETYRYRHHRLTSDAALASTFGARVERIRAALGVAPRAERAEPNVAMLARVTA